MLYKETTEGFVHFSQDKQFIPCFEENVVIEHTAESKVSIHIQEAKKPNGLVYYIAIN